MILPAVLIVVGLLALIMASFVFFVRSKVASSEAQRDMLQARLAAESGLREVQVLLQTSSNNPMLWWDNPPLFRHVLVWSQKYNRDNDPVRERQFSRTELLQGEVIIPTWRYSVVGAYWDNCQNCGADTGEAQEHIRYGVTAEAGRLNLNGATEGEIKRLMQDVLTELGVENWEELADALLDWLDADDEPRPMGAERDYYMNLVPPYIPKNGRLDTIDELLLVRGFSAAILYGEDVNRNGLLDANENDADLSFPEYDNADGILNPGLAPFVTVWSRESLTAGTGGTGGNGNDNTGGDENGNDNDGLGDPNDEGGLGVETEGEGVESLGSDPNSLIKVHVATAPIRVLRCLEGMTPEAAARVAQMRKQQPPEALQNLTWLVSSGALDQATYAAVQNRLTTKALQFRVEILGYADHLKVAQRYEWIVELRGLAAQVLYHRDLTSLGFAWPIDNDALALEPGEQPATTAEAP